ncbi:MAG: hypothetical protein K8S87_10660 [Planctomycetes bacterium]|nr:hypothetical protein [Planctomycetota bacterium]
MKKLPKLLAFMIAVVFLINSVIAETFILKNEQVAKGEIIQETEAFIIVKKADNSRGYIRKNQVEYRIPDMKVAELLEKAQNYTKKNDYKTAYYFYLAAEFAEPKKIEVIAGLAICLIKRKEYDKALSKVKYGLLWENNNQLLLLSGEIYSLKGEFDKADEIFIKLKKNAPKLAKTINDMIKENQERRLYEKARTSTPSIKDFKDKVGNCQDAVDNAKELLKWSQESDKKTFIAVNLSVYSVGKKETDFEKPEDLRKAVSVVDLKIIVVKERFYGLKTVLEDQERKILALGWYFFIRSTYYRAKKINIDICYEYTNRKKEKKLVTFARVKWGTNGENMNIEYTR